MRISKTSNGLKVQAIAGTYVVILGIDLPEKKCVGLMGFSLHRQDHSEAEGYYLEGMKCFQATDPGAPDGSRFSTKDHPVQDFTWSDYTAKPNHTYTYTVCALTGNPKALTAFAKTEVTVTTESPISDEHEIYFNRGVSASQEYVRRFGDVKPKKTDLPNTPKFKWLSRGLYEAIADYIESCVPGIHTLRIAAYEFKYEPFAQLLRRTIDRGVDVRIIYDARKKEPKEANELLIKDTKLSDFCTGRKNGVSISHNKFIIKLEHGVPIAILTGGTNFSANGIFGHSNVAHVVKNSAVAKMYLDYWELLKLDHPLKGSQQENTLTFPTPDLANIPVGTTVIFSPRTGLGALELYRDLAMKAKNGFFMTFAFGINKLFKDVYRNSTADLRLALMERKTRVFNKEDEALKIAEEADIQALRNMPANIFAIGNLIKTNKLDGWVLEELAGLSSNVKYIHNKFMLVDPLGPDPIVVAGSANFSDASTKKNDENMLLIRGNTTVADIYLGEFMRLWKHHSFRESLSFKSVHDRFLKTDDWWKKYYQNTDNAARRKYFSNNQ
ncbi:MAG TPA: phospholipase D-like domain-containing protein [Pedobacter sp.]|uniref:phospholipase D-like domain-containing protein n=1 Tax=Pedobacter sp. TaxID=1411316 RepID=UPI002BBD40BC|nr:phospholipase D-like domain-containing protein [Pedobacter sp.]HMI03710.1 phospholipase D-like domain-containing protein [Pedobacter sp.]